MTSALLSLFLASSPATPAASPAEQPPPLERVLADAKAHHQPVFLDIYTSWCKPCAHLAKEVFPRPEVQKALEGWRFVSYDAEKGPGIDVAERFDVHSYPTLLILSSAGEKLAEVESQQPNGIAAELDRFRKVAASDAPMLALAAAEPADAQVQLLAAEQAEQGTPEQKAQVKTLLTRALAADPGNQKGVAAQAALRLAKREAGERDARTHGALLLSFANRYPGPEAVDALSGIAALPPTTRPAKGAIAGAVHRSVSALVKAGAADALNTLVYVAMDLGAHAQAIEAGKALAQLTPKDANDLDSLAEAYFQAGDAKQAVAIEERALALGSSAGLEQNLKRFRSEKPSGTALMSHRDPLAQSPEVDPMLAWYQKTQEEVRTFETRLTDQVHQACPKVPMLEFMRLTLAKGAVQKATLLDPDVAPELRACAEKAALQAKPLPRPWKDGVFSARLEVRLPH